jgi:hypothetical protein
LRSVHAATDLNVKSKSKPLKASEIGSIVTEGIASGALKAAVNALSDAARLVRHCAQPKPAVCLVERALEAQAVLREVIVALQEASDYEKIPTTEQRAAWMQIAAVLSNGVSQMNKLAVKRPELFGFAKKECYWPVLKSRGLGFLEDEPDESVLFRTLALSEEVDIKVVGTKWRHDAVGKLAIELYEQVSNGRLFDLDPKKMPICGPTGTVRAALVSFVEQCNAASGSQTAIKPGTSPRHEGKSLKELHRAADDFRVRSKQLPHFLHEGAWLKWLSLAYEIFEQRWRNPTQQEELSRLVTSETKRKSGGRIKARLKELIKERFQSMAGVKHRPGR